MILNIFLTLFLVFLNGFFVAAEFAIVKVRMSQLELRIRTGYRFATLSKKIVNHLDAYLSATQLGITLASLGLGWIGEPVVAAIIGDIITFLGFKVDAVLIHKISLPIAFVTITFLHIVFGELAPKSLAIQKSEQVTLAVSYPLRFFYILFKPFIYVLNNFANMILKWVGIRPAGEAGDVHSAEELRFLLEEGTKKGVLEVSEHKLIENIFEFWDTPIKQIMIPRGNIVGIEISMSSIEIHDKFIDEGYSRMPVYQGTIDNIIGVIYAKDLISLMNYNQIIIVQDIIRPAFFVSENEKINNLLKTMQRNKNHIAIVLDEFGGTAGLVTIEDIIEEIVGEIQDEYDEEIPLIEKVNDKEFILQSVVPISDLNKELNQPLPESDDYQTVAGLLTNITGKIPEINETIDFDGYQFKVLKRSRRKIEVVKLILKQGEV